MHLVNSSWSEFNTEVQTGSHQITATVEIPNEEIVSILPRNDKEHTQLDDILLLLTIFTGRSVFKKTWITDKNIAIIWDHRIHHYWWQLICSIEYKSMWKNKKTRKLITEEKAKDIKWIHNEYNKANIWFEETLNQILIKIYSEERQNAYDGWYFLFLYKDALPRQILEKSFLTCWTIWEQIFAIENKKWMPDEDIFKTGWDKKIAYILTKYFSKNIDKVWRNNIRRITNSRNRLVHFWKKSINVSNEEKDMFIRLTEQLISIILWLNPSNIFNSTEWLDLFLKQKI